MDRINEAEGGVVVSGKRMFSDGDPSPGGHAPSRISARIMNAIAEEIIAVIENADIKLENHNNTQLKEAIIHYSQFAQYDVIATSARSLEQLKESIRRKSKILVTSDQIIESTLEIKSDYTTIECLPGVKIEGSPGLSGEMFSISGASVTFKNVILGMKKPGPENYVFALADKGKHFIISDSRIFGFQNRSFYKGSNPIVQSGLVLMADSPNG